MLLCLDWEEPTQSIKQAHKLAEKVSNIQILGIKVVVYLSYGKVILRNNTTEEHICAR